MSASAKSPNRRRKYVLDPRWQLSVSLGVAGLALGTGLLCLLGTYFFLSNDPLESLSGSQIALVALIVNAGYFVILSGLTLFVALRITHAVVGPAMVLERAIEGLRNGRFDSRLKLRQGDYLKSLASAIQRLSADLERQQVERDRACQELEEAVSPRDRKNVGRILAEIRTVRTTSEVRESSADRNAA